RAPFVPTTSKTGSWAARPGPRPDVAAWPTAGGVAGAAAAAAKPGTRGPKWSPSDVSRLGSSATSVWYSGLLASELQSSLVSEAAYEGSWRTRYASTAIASLLRMSGCRLFEVAAGVDVLSA